MKDQDFVVIYDTYCGWCYGAAPVIDALVATGAKVEAVHRHLFQGPQAYRMADGRGAKVLQADARIAALTGQVFSQRYIDQVVLSDTEVLASAFTAQAAALVHDQGAAAEFALSWRLQQARYVDGVSAADRDAMVAALVAEGVPIADAEKVGSPELAARAQTTSERAQQLMRAVGASGVPTVLRVRDDGYEVVDHAAFYGRPGDAASLAHALNASNLV